MRKILNSFILGFWLGLMLTACHSVSVSDTAQTLERVEEAEALLDDPGTVVYTTDETGELSPDPEAKARINTALADCANDLPIVSTELLECRAELASLVDDAAIGRAAKWIVIVLGIGGISFFLIREALQFKKWSLS